MTTPEQQAVILADEPWIGTLIERLKAGDVYWRDQENRLLRVLRVQLDWIEFTDDPNPVAEPAAFLDGGAIVALWNTNPENFVVSAPALQYVSQPENAQTADEAKLIFSQSEFDRSDGAGFWSDDVGWTDFEQATRFTLDAADHDSVLFATKKDDAFFMLERDARSSAYEKRITDFLVQEITDGGGGPIEDIVARAVRFGLMEPQAFLDEMEERMEESEEPLVREREKG